MGVSQILFMYISNLIDIAFNIMNMKNQNILRVKLMRACKQNKELEIVTKPYELFSKSPNHGRPPTKHI